MHDLVIRNGFVVDGTGAPGRAADVAIDDGSVTAVTAAGEAGAARRVLDASGLLVTPGWVDAHTHYDAQVSWDPWLTPSSWHGVTTVVMGNCGVGFAPVAPDRHEWLIELMEGVEDIPGSAMADGITWAWTTFPEYLDAIGNSARVIDVATQIAHGPLRAFVMGERGAANEPATPAEIETMGRLVHEAMAAGALGFSTSRTPIHRSKSGELVPGTTAGAEELVGIARSIQAAGGGVFQFAPEHVRLVEDEWPWMVDLARSTGVTVSVNLNQDRRAADLWQDVLGRLDEANAQGVPIVAQVAGRSIGILQCLEGSLHPLMFHPAYAEVAELPLTERVAALHDVERRRRLIEEIPDDGGFFRSAVIERTDGMFPVDQESIDYEPGPEHSVRAIAARRGVADLEVVLETLLADEGRGMLYTPFFNYAYGDLSMTYELHRNGNTRMGLSDAGAHCGAICDGGTPTFMLTHWTRDRTRGPKLPLELVVHRQTQQTATLYGLRDRGVLTPGARADVNVIDYDSLGFDRPRMAYDFPAGARRLVQRGRGYVATFVRGTQIVDHDEFTGALPGELVRGRRAGPAPMR